MAIFPFNKLFKKTTTARELIAELKLQERTLDDNKRELKLDLKQAKRSIDKVVAQGTEAARSGDGFGQREAALELKRLKADSQFVMGRLNQIVKAEMLTRISLQKLEWAERSKDQNIFSGIQKVLSSENVQKMIQKAEISADQFGADLDRLFEKEVGKLDEAEAAMEMETTSEEALFAQLAAAQEQGDEELVREINTKLIGEPANSKMESEPEIG